jgi:hypothetical protein
MLVAGLLGTPSAGAAAGFGVVADEPALLATPWAGATFGRFGVALQAPLRFVDDGLRPEDWDEPADYGRLVRFVRWGEESDPVAARAGVVARRTLGQGTLVRRYHNGTDDDHARVGLDARARGERWALDAFSDQLLGPPVVAARASVQVLPPLSLGATFAADTAMPADVDGRVDRTGAFVARRVFFPGYGADVSASFGVREVAVLTTYVEVNALDQSDVGVHVGAQAWLAAGEDWRFALRAEYLHAGEDYDWAWFDTTYLVRRAGGRPGAPAAEGGRGGVEVTYADAATFGFEYADASGDRRGDLSAWVEVPGEAGAFTAFYARRGAAGDLLSLVDVEESLAAAAARRRLSGPWWVGATLARVWRVERLEGDRGVLRPFTEAALTLEAAFGL